MGRPHIPGDVLASPTGSLSLLCEQCLPQTLQPTPLLGLATLSPALGNSHTGDTGKFASYELNDELFSG